MPQSELGKRIAVAAVGIPATVLAIYLGGWVLGVVLALFAAGGAIELYRIAEQNGIHAFIPLGAALAALFVLFAAGQRSAAEAMPRLWQLTVAALLVAAGAAVWRRGAKGRPLSAVAVTVAGALLPGATLAYAVFLRHDLPALAAVPAGGSLLASALELPGAWARTALVAYAIGLTWANDACAYFVGRAVGRKPLIPGISPGKTVAGALGGLLGAVVLAGGYTALVLQPLGVPLSPLLGGLGGAIIAVVAQVGDLAESLFKREAGVKDSGRILPGHGGILDRLDALFFVLPVAYWYLAWAVGPWVLSPAAGP